MSKNKIPACATTATAHAKPANPDSAISLIALSSDGGTANLATILVPTEDASSNDKKTKLTKEEKSSLDRCEQVIERGLATFIEVGAALHEIQAQRLYRQTHNSFEAYLTSRWSFKRAHAYRLIAAYRALEKIQDEDGKDLSESHVRQLVRLPEDQRTEALRRAKELAGEGTRTSKHIKQAVDAMLGNETKAAAEPPVEEDTDGDDSESSGGQPNPQLPTPPSPTGGSTLPIELRNTVAPVDVEEVNVLLALARETRDVLTMRGDVDAAIQLLFRIEQVLTRRSEKARYNKIEILEPSAAAASNVYRGQITAPRQLQAA